MGTVNRRQLKGRRKLSATAERLLVHLWATAPVIVEDGVSSSGIPARAAWTALLALEDRKFVRMTGYGDEPTLCHVTPAGVQHAQQMASHAA